MSRLFQEVRERLGLAYTSTATSASCKIPARWAYTPRGHQQRSKRRSMIRLARCAFRQERARSELRKHLSSSGRLALSMEDSFAVVPGMPPGTVRSGGAEPKMAMRAWKGLPPTSSAWRRTFSARSG